MRAFLILIVLVAIFCEACSHTSKQRRTGYLLSIDQDKIAEPRDSIIGGKPYELLWVPVELSNFSNDTLKYMSMTCSWDVIFKINKETASIAGWGCDQNILTFSAIAPQKSFTYRIPILIQRNAFSNSYNLEIGMYVINYNGGKGFKDLENFLRSNKTSFKSLIWSNEITISK